MSKIYDKYLMLKKEDSDKLYLFKCGKFYIFLSDDCDLINEYLVLNKTTFSKETYKCGFPVDSLEQYLKIFKKHNLDVVVIDDIEVVNDKFNDKIINMIKQIDIDNIKPIDALLILRDLKEMLYE